MNRIQTRDRLSMEESVRASVEKKSGGEGTVAER